MQIILRILIPLHSNSHTRSFWIVYVHYHNTCERRWPNSSQSLCFFLPFPVSLCWLGPPDPTQSPSAKSVSLSRSSGSVLHYSCCIYHFQLFFLLEALYQVMETPRHPKSANTFAMNGWYILPTGFGLYSDDNMVFLFWSVIWHMNRSSRDLLWANQVSQEVLYPLCVFQFGFAIVSFAFCVCSCNWGWPGRSVLTLYVLSGFGVEVMRVP